MLAGSAFKNKGIQPLLDAVVDYLPSPLDVPPVEGIDRRPTKSVLRRASDDQPFSALAFKIMSDPFVGHVTYIRVYSGVLKSGSYVYNSTKQTRERIGRLLRMHANKREEIDAIYAGDIAACVGLKSVTTGDTLCDEDKPIVLENIEFPAPVISVAIEPKTKADQDKLGNAMQRLAQEDPTFRVHTDPDTGQTLISGMGELHLEIIVDRMMREFGVQANVGRPQVAYRETIRKQAGAEGKYIKQTGGRGQYGHCKIEVLPLPSSPGTKTCTRCPPTNWTPWPRKSGGSAANGGSTRSTACCSSTRSWAGRFPRNLSPPIEAGIREAMENGILAGYEMVDIAVVLIDGSYHEVDSSEMAFKIAGSMAFKEACAKAKPVLLEPIMKVEVVTPEEYMAAGVRRPEFAALPDSGHGEPRRASNVIRVEVPLAEMFGYATDLRSRTQGRASFTMHFSHYAEAPASVAEEVIAKATGQGDSVEESGASFAGGFERTYQAEERTERWRRKNSSAASRT